LLKKVFYVKRLIFKLCLPQDLVIHFNPYFSPKNNPNFIILNIYKKWSQKARSKLSYAPPFMCIECVSMEEFVHSALSPSPKSEVSRIYASLEAVIQASEKT
jgi:hypothetical protein